MALSRPTTTATTTTRDPITHTVEVGKGGWTISPDIVLAEVGDYIEYDFYPRNHSIVRADYEFPCVPYELVHTSPGFFSGFKPVDAILDEPPKFTVRVNDTDPIFVYCSGPEACDEYGMVAVVNPNATTSLEAHRQAAMNASYQLQPGDKWPEEGSPPSDDHDEDNEEYPTSTSSTVSGTNTGTAAEATSSTIGTSSTSHSGLAPGAIAGIAIGAAAIALLAGIAVWICGRKSRKSRQEAADGSWSLGLGGGSRRDPLHSGAATPATIPPAYNAHGVPVMTQPNKAYPGQGTINTSIIEQYGPPGAVSPPMAPQMFPAAVYPQHSIPPHILDPAAFSHNPYGGMPAGLAQNPPHQHQQPPYQYPQPGLQQQQQQQPFYRPEIYSGTPAPQQMPDTSPLPNGRESMTMSHGSHSRGGSPDIINEMNAMSRSPGTINQGGGARPDSLTTVGIHEPSPERVPMTMEIKRVDVAP